MPDVRECGRSDAHQRHNWQRGTYRYGKPVQQYYMCPGLEVVTFVGVPALDGATNTPPEGMMLNGAGEFAARWNTIPPAERERLWKAIQGACNDGYQCHVKDHEGMEHQFGVQARKLDHARSEIQGLLDSLDSHVTHDEIYSQLKTIQEAL